MHCAGSCLGLDSTAGKYYAREQHEVTASQSVRMGGEQWVAGLGRSPPRSRLSPAKAICPLPLGNFLLSHLLISFNPNGPPYTRCLESFLLRCLAKVLSGSPQGVVPPPVEGSERASPGR